LNTSKELSISSDLPAKVLQGFQSLRSRTIREVLGKSKNSKFLHKTAELGVPRNTPENVRYCAAGQLLVAGRFSKGDF